MTSTTTEAAAAAAAASTAIENEARIRNSLFIVRAS